MSPRPRCHLSRLSLPAPQWGLWGPSLDEPFIPCPPLDPVQGQETPGGKVERADPLWSGRSTLTAADQSFSSPLSWEAGGPSGKDLLWCRSSTQRPFHRVRLRSCGYTVCCQRSLPKEPLSLCARASTALATSRPPRERVLTGVVNFRGPLAGPQCPVLGQTSV